MPSNRESKSRKGTDSTLSLPPGLTLSITGCNRGTSGSALVLVMRDFDLLCVFQWCATGTVTTGVSVCHQTSASAGMGGAAPLVRQVSAWQWLILLFAAQNPCASPTAQCSHWELLLNELKPKRRPSTGQSLRRPWVYVTMQKFRCLCKYS